MDSIILARNILLIFSFILTFVRIVSTKLLCLAVLKEYNSSACSDKSLYKYKRWEWEFFRQTTILVVCAALFIAVLISLREWVISGIVTMTFVFSAGIITFLGYFIFSNAIDVIISYQMYKYVTKIEQSMFESVFNKMLKIFFICFKYGPYVAAIFITAFLPMEKLFGLGIAYDVTAFRLRFAPISFIITRIIYDLVFPYAYPWFLRAKPIENKCIAQFFSEIANSNNINIKIYQFQSLKSPKEDCANVFAMNSLRAKIFISDYILKNMIIDELKALLLHEIGHLKNRHLSKQQRLTMWGFLLYLIVVLIPLTGLNLLADLYSARENEFISMVLFISSLAVMIMGTIAYYKYVICLKVIPFLKNQEKEADAYVIKCGVEPHVLISALQKIYYLNDYSSYSKKLVEVFSTHPSLENRIKYINQFAESMGK